MFKAISVKRTIKFTSVIQMDSSNTENKVTVTRALAELKTLEKRIVKAVADCEIVKVRRKGDKWDIQEFNRQAQGAYQSTVDLIARRDELKSKVLTSNSVTKVRIGKEDLTVAEVIDRKQAIKYKKSLLERLRTQRQYAQSTFDARTEELRVKLDHLLEVNFGKEGKSNPENVTAISKTYYDTNKVELVDSVNIAARIKDLEDEVTEFDKEADLVLSESNARNYI